MAPLGVGEGASTLVLGVKAAEETGPPIGASFTSAVEDPSSEVPIASSSEGPAAAAPGEVVGVEAGALADKTSCLAKAEPIMAKKTTRRTIWRAIFYVLLKLKMNMICIYKGSAVVL